MFFWKSHFDQQKQIFSVTTVSPRRSTGAAGTQLTAAQSVNRTTGTGENSVKRICPQVFVLKYWICIFFFYSYCLILNGLYNVYNLCSPGNTRKVAGGSAKGRQRVRGRALLPTHVIWVFSCNTNNNNNNNKASANYHLKTPEWACQMIICRCGKVFSCSVFSQDWKKKDFPPIVKSGWSKHISNLRLALGGYVLRSYWVKTEHFLAVRHLRQAQTAQSIILLSS